MAAFAPQTAKVEGTALTLNACNSGGDTVTGNDGSLRLLFVNGSGGSITITIPAKDNAPVGQTDSDLITVAAGATVMTSVFPTARFPTTLALSYSGVSSLTVAVVK